MTLSGQIESLESSVPNQEVREPRRNVRFPADADTPPIQFQNTLGQTVVGKLINESYSGVAAAIACPEGLTLGQEVSVVYFGQPAPGMIRRLMPEPGGNWLVAIQWK